MQNRRLIIRLSSLGDLILASTVLSIDDYKWDWIVSKDFAHLLEGHPGIRKLWVYDKKTGLLGWLRLLAEVRLCEYEEIVDLHNSLRSFIARIFFAFNGFFEFRVISKNRFRRIGYFIFKDRWPVRFRPWLWKEKFSTFLGGTGKENPNLSHLIEIESDFTKKLKSVLEKTNIGGNPVVAIMPSTQWIGKNWPVERYLRWIEHKDCFPIVMGRMSDLPSTELSRLLRQEEIPHFSAVGDHTISETAQVLTLTERLVCGDTGLAHLAEALGIPVTIFYGPTTPDLGFGPRLEDSHALSKKLFCSPCSKDGRACIRPLNRYACLRDFTFEEAEVADQNLPVKQAKVYLRSSDVRVEIYRFFARLILPKIMKRKLLIDGNELDGRPVWFHASSVGELESLRPLIDRCLEKNVDLLVTAFSASADWAIEKLKTDLERDSNNNDLSKIRFLGASPVEGQWKDALLEINPKILVTDRYEAWPDLWWSLGELGIPLMVLGGRPRSSLVWIRRLTKIFGALEPRITFFVNESRFVRALEDLFPSQEILLSEDLRWERVRQRSSNKEVFGALEKNLDGLEKELKRPWGVLGSVWSSDIDYIGKELHRVPGTVFCVPHKIDEKTMLDICSALDRIKIDYSITTNVKTQVNVSKVVVVREMAVLAELYSFADWAYVGGGFGSGIHSTIEPAIHGIPIICGPNGIDKFSEIEFLSQMRQLKVLRTSDDFKKWIASGAYRRKDGVRDKWKAAIGRKCGVLESVFSELERRAGQSCP